MPEAPEVFPTQKLGFLDGHFKDGRDNPGLPCHRFCLTSCKGPGQQPDSLQKFIWNDVPSSCLLRDISSHASCLCRLVALFLLTPCIVGSVYQFPPISLLFSENPFHVSRDCQLTSASPSVRPPLSIVP